MAARQVPVLAAALVLLLAANPAHGLLEIEFSLSLLASNNPKAWRTLTDKISAYGSSQQGIKYLVRDNLFEFGDSLPPALRQSEPGLSRLAAAVEAYSCFLPAVDFAARLTRKEGSALAQPLNRWAFSSQAPANSGAGRPLTSEVWFDLRDGPLVITVPEAADGTYWLLSFYDFFSEQFFAVGSQPSGNAGDKWLLTPPKYHGSTTGFAAKQVIEAPTTQGYFLLHASFRAAAGADKFSKGLKLSTLSGGQPPSPTSAGLPEVDATSALQVVNADLLADLYFWQVAGQVLAAHPKPSLPNPLKSQLEWLGFDGTGFHKDRLTDVSKLALTYAPAIAARLIEARLMQAGPKENQYWSQWELTGQYGSDYLLGASLAQAGLPGGSAQHQAHYFQLLDGTGKPLLGSHRYRISFPAEPPRDPAAFMSLEAITLRDLALSTAGLTGKPAGASNRKVVAAREFSKRHDGTFDILVGPQQPDKLKAGETFFQTPGQGPLLLVLQVFGGQGPVPSGSYVPPEVHPLDAPAEPEYDRR